jgi:hypothetical protein
MSLRRKELALSSSVTRMFAGHAVDNGGWNINVNAGITWDNLGTFTWDTWTLPWGG